MKTKSNLLQTRVWSGVVGVLCVVFPGEGDERAILTTPDGPPSKLAEAIPWSQIGAKVAANYKGEGLAVSPTEAGARLRCVFQQLEGQATTEGLWLTSTVPGQPNDRFCVMAMAVERTGLIKRTVDSPSPLNGERAGVRAGVRGEAVQPLPRTGKVSSGDQTVRFVRPGLVEEYTVSMEGVRQDFVVLEKPGGASIPARRLASSLAAPTEGQLRVELAVTGARVEPIAGGVHPVKYAGQAVDHEQGNMLSHGARLVLEKSGRKIAYSRLRVTDATGKVLTARMDVAASRQSAAEMKQEDDGGLPTRRYACLAVLVDDARAVYPIRIDPTFSDANWISFGELPGANNRAYAAVVDGSGNLYIGGDFTIVGDAIANGIAKWNGSSWSGLGSGINGSVYALAVSGSNLYAGGYFRTAGGVAATNIAKWNGSNWSALGSGMNDYVYVLAVSGGNLFAGGSFTKSGGITVNRIAKWSGSWSALGLGIQGPSTVSALAVSGSTVYVGGQFTTAGGNAAMYIAKWDGSSWSALGSGMNGSVSALAVSGSSLYAGGSFTTAGGITANRIAKWNGSSWSALGLGLGVTNSPSPVSALAVSGSDLYVGGHFTTAGGGAANYVAKWNGSNWSALGSGMNSSGYVSGLAVSGSDLYAVGWFTVAGGKVSEYVARAVLGDAPGHNQLTGTPLSGDSMQFSYVGYPATNYALDRAFSLSPPISWVGQQTNTMTVSGVLMFTNTPVPGTNNFWRVRSVP